MALPSYKPKPSKATTKSVAAAKRVASNIKPGATSHGSSVGTTLKTSAPASVAPASYSTPAAMGAVTPIAAPPVVNDPFLTPTDLANQAIDLANVDQYLSDVDLQVGNARVDASLKTGEIDRSEGRNLEAADWNSAARGLQASSIKDTKKAELSTDAAASRTATKGNLSNAETYASAAHLRSEGTVKPAINSKYNDLAVRNAQEKTDREAAIAAQQDDGGGDPQPQGSAAPAAQPRPGTPAWAAKAVANNESWKQVKGKWYRMTASGKWMLTNF